MNPRSRTPKAWPDHRPELLPFLPLVHSVWADGVLTDSDVEGLGAWLESQEWLSPEARQDLAHWLNAGSPPSPSELASLLARMRATDFPDPSAAGRSLSDLGLTMAGLAGDTPQEADQTTLALRSLEELLGVVGRDAARRALGPSGVGKARPGTTPGFDGPTLTRYLRGSHGEIRERVMAALAAEPVRIPWGLQTAEHRERVLHGLQALADQGFGAMGYPVEFGGTGDPSAAVAVFETLGFGDMSLMVKFGVQFGLFGGSVLQLGTRRHHEEFLEAIGTLEIPGCYAMTETGHGSNVRDLETTATYDPDRDAFVVHTPHESAAKDWIGNAALHGRLATVFARLTVGGEDHGIHALLVPIRDKRGRARKGVRIEDRGLKQGLNGVDNGRLWFDQVRVPRDNLLDRFASVGADGTYHSDIPSSGRRFFTMLGTLVTGRICIAAAAVSAAKTGLTVAIRYADERRQFGPEGEHEVPILDYLSLQRRLMPALATTYGLHFAVRDLESRVEAGLAGDDPELEVHAAGLKAYASTHGLQTLHACREACGGQGYLAANRFGPLLADTDVFTTFEGANPVLLQLVAKGLLSRFRHDMGDLHFWGAVRYVAERASTRLAELNPVITRRTDSEHLRDPAFHAAAFEYRDERLLRSVALRLKHRLDEGVDTFDAINQCQDHLIHLANAHVERCVLSAFHRAVVHAPHPGLSEALKTLSALFALSRVEADRAWFLEAGYLESGKSRAVRAEVASLCGDIRGVARVLVDGFGIPDVVLAAPAAGSEAAPGS